MNIKISTIPHKEQRYPTCGDYFNDGDSVQFKISQMDNQDYEFLVTTHELIEHHLITKKGIKIEDIDAFDKNFEEKRSATNESEPGDDKRAPYYQEHQIATGIERVLAAILDVDWTEYEEAIDDL